MTLGKRSQQKLPKKRLVVKDKFYRKKDWAFLDARNTRFALAAKILKGSSCVFLDSPKLGTSKALLKGGIPATKIFPVNGKDEGGFKKNAEKLGLLPVVSMFHASTDSPELRGKRDVAVCYNDGTHGDPDLVWRDMSPWIQKMPRQAYVSYTFCIRSRNAVPVTASFGILLMMARRGFRPPGGWERLREAFTFDGRMFNVQMERGLCGSKARDLAALAADNSYSLSEKYLRARKKEAWVRDPSELKQVVRCLSLRRKEVKRKDRDHFLNQWQHVRKSISLLGPKGEKEVLGHLPEASWVRKQYQKWLGSSSGRHSTDLIKRFPHRRKAAEAAHWQKASRWLSEALQQHFSSDPRHILVSAENHPNFGGYLSWLRGAFPGALLKRMLCVNDRGLSPGIKANVTRHRSSPLRAEESLQELRQMRSHLLAGKGSFDVALLPILNLSAYEDVLQRTDAVVSELSKRCVLLIHLKSEQVLCTLTWAVHLIGHLASSSGFQLSDCCDLLEDGSELMDYSRILTLVLSRGL
jgi:hypothetical protein